MKKLILILLAIGLAVGTATADGKISDLGALAEAPAAGDLVELVDVSDTSMAATGTNKKITSANLFAGLVALEGDQTIAGAKTFTSTIAGKIPAVAGGSANISLSEAQVSGTTISNTGQGPNDRNHTLPTATPGLSFIGVVGEAQAANYFRFTRGASDTMCLDGTCAKTYVSIAAPTQGAQVACYTIQMAHTGMNGLAGLAIGTTTTAVQSDAFAFDIAGTGYTSDAVAAGTAPGTTVIPEGTFGAVAFEIGADSVISAVPATDNATGYGSAALAVEGLPAVEAEHVRLGYVTASSSSGTFEFGTTALSAANTTVAYTDTSIYTKPLVWQCGKSIGTWVTD